MFKKTVFRVVLFLPLIYWCYLLFSDQIGADPANFLNHQVGQFALYLLLFNLLIGLLIYLKASIPLTLRFLLAERRAIGLISFFYLVLHALFYFAMESFEQKAWAQLLTKKYLIFSGIAWLIILSLAMTSNDGIIKKLTYKKWKNWHRLIYLAMCFITAHVLLIEKADLVKYGFILSGFFMAQLLRFRKTKN